MTPYQPPNQDEHHLQLLSIFHYVVAALVALVACFPIIHLVIGLVFLLAPPETFATPHQSQPPTLFIGLMFTILPAVMLVFGWTAAICIFLGGRSIARRKHYVFCLIVAAICCFFMPFGTALGVFSIIVLIRPSVKALFDNAQFGQSPAQKGKPW
jgi:hypothetical protein